MSDAVALLLVVAALVVSGVAVIAGGMDVAFIITALIR